MTATSRSRVYGLASPFFRHVAVVLIGMAVVLLPAFGLRLPVEDGLPAWLAIAGVAGVLAGLIGRGWLGLLFLALGLGVGMQVMLAWQFGLPEAALHEVTDHGALYLAVGAVAIVGYALATARFLLVRRRR